MSKELSAGRSSDNKNQELIEAFVQRLAARDTPPPLANDPASVQQRLVEALRPLLPDAMNRRLARAARICYAFLAQASWTAQALTGTVGGHRGTTNRTLAGLREAGLVRCPTQGVAARYELTREGEALLLSVIAPEPAG